MLHLSSSSVDNDATLTQILERELTSRIDADTKRLVILPASEHDRAAGRVQGMAIALNIIQEAVRKWRVSDEEAA